MGLEDYYVRIPSLRSPSPPSDPLPVPGDRDPLDPPPPSHGVDPFDAARPSRGGDPLDAVGSPAGAAFGEIPLAEGTGKRFALTQSVLFGLLGIALGLGFIVLVWFLQLITIFLSSPFTRGEWMVVFACAAMIAVGGIVIGVVTYLPWRTRPTLRAEGDHLVLTYPAFRGTFVVPRELIRVIAFDDRPAQMFRNNKRFPVEGEVPGEAFKDALDNFPRPPWEPFAHTLPVLAGMDPEREQFLFSGDGTSLPVLRTNAEDVPNMAVIFHEPLRLPPHHLALHAGPCASPLYTGPRTVRGMMLRVMPAVTAESVLAPWGLTRRVTADDVLEEGLFLPKPLRGWRIWALAGLLALMVAMKLAARSL